MRTSATSTMLRLLVAFLLANLVSCVACDVHIPKHDQIGVPVNPDSLTQTSKTAKRVSIPPAKPVVNITAVFEEQDLDDFLPTFERALSDIVNESIIFTWTGHVLNASSDLKTMVAGMCAHFSGDKSQVRLILVFGRVRTIQTVNLISEVLGIPAIGYMLGKGDGYVQVHNPLFLSLQPSNKHLAKGLVSLLEINFWFRLTLITQEELRHDGFHRTFKELTKDGKWTIEDEIFISTRSSIAALNASLGALRGNFSRIFIVHATEALTRRIFGTARQVLPKRNRFAWIITDNSYTRDEHVLRDFPLGTKAFLVNHEVKSEELLKDVLDFTLEAIQGNGKLGLVFSLTSTPPSSSSFVLTSLSSALSSINKKYSSGKNKAYGCWSADSELVHSHQNPVYSALLSTSTYGLTGHMAFDEDGFMNVSKFRVRNLVSDGRQNVWQDIGCVQGKGIRPFGIIWPGDAQNLKSETEGKKRYKVVTNPVQPFVMTEAPHSDYKQCLSDTPCLNLTNKLKSQDIVWRAIEAYERGEGPESGLFTIQCCRGLTIDLLNKLAADLEFEFTLYIVQDETYGQRELNGSWTGMMRDLTDNTAHFAVAAFSITSQRDAAIDFTDPYFFSGFSIIYSDKTRETSMLAFLEPFSTRVWFAILVSAQITAVCMALLEWNSPFGLNPWGRKRNKNYSLASGVTMVFSVLFGHTVRTKSPKAWPSKFLQNIWAFGAIFIISSYTANLAAFIAGKHAGINYIDIQDTRLQNIRLGVLNGSAVHEMLRNGRSKLASVAERNPVPKTDVGIDWVIKGRLDALLGDYSILDYARAHLAPSCELKLISKLFGEDRYGLGLPKDSPLKTALSTKISEYHLTGYIDDLIDVHFADAHCIKKRLSEEDSQLEVTHHAGLFVMLCVGFLVGALVLFIEHVAFKFLVPYIRQCPETSVWRSIHLMFLSQRLQRIITSAELVSPHHSAKEMLSIFKNREFARLFQKSTIRRNRLADLAKAKRINRNFYDIVEKAKWLKKMTDSGLMEDDDSLTPTIIEIPLKQLTVNVEQGTSHLQMDNSVESSVLNRNSHNSTIDMKVVPDISSGETSSPDSDDSLIRNNEKVADKSLPNIYKISGPILPLQTLKCSPSSSSRRLQKCSRDHRRRRSRHQAEMVSSSELQNNQVRVHVEDNGTELEYHSQQPAQQLFEDHSSYTTTRDYLPNSSNIHHLYSESSLLSDSVANDLVSRYIAKHQLPVTIANSTDNRVRFSDCLPKKFSMNPCGQRENAEDCTVSDDADEENVLCEEQTPTVLGDHSHLQKTISDDSHNLAGAGASASNYSNKALLPKTNNIRLAQSLLHKTRSYQDHLCSAADSAQAEASIGPFSLDSVTKEELLVLWKSSEIELTKRLEAALKEKSRLERKLAMLQKHSLV